MSDSDFEQAIQHLMKEGLKRWEAIAEIEAIEAHECWLEYIQPVAR